MGRLRRLPPRVAALGGRIATHRDAEGHGRTMEPWRAWYGQAEWRRLKAEVHARDLCECQEPEHVGPRLIQQGRERIADHKVPHRGDRALFFDPSNVWTLCKTCHDGRKQAEERRARAAGRV